MLVTPPRPDARHLWGRGTPEGPLRPLSLLTRVSGVPGPIAIQALPPPASVAGLSSMRIVSVILGIPRDPGFPCWVGRATFLGQTSSSLPLLQCRYVPARTGPGLHEVFLMLLSPSPRSLTDPSVPAQHYRPPAPPPPPAARAGRLPSPPSAKYLTALTTPPPVQSPPPQSAGEFRACQWAHALTLQANSFLVTGIPCNVSGGKFQTIVESASAALGLAFPLSHYMDLHRSRTWQLLPYHDDGRDEGGRTLVLRKCSLLLRAPTPVTCGAGGTPEGPLRPLSLLTRVTGVPGPIAIQAIPPDSVAGLSSMRIVSVIRGIPRDPLGSLAGLVRATFLGQASSSLPLLQCRYVPARTGPGLHEVFLMLLSSSPRSLTDPSVPARTAAITRLGLPLHQGPSLQSVLTAPPLPAWADPIPVLRITGVRNGGTNGDAIPEALSALHLAPSQVRGYYTARHEDPTRVYLLLHPDRVPKETPRSGRLRTAQFQDIGGTHTAFRKYCFTKDVAAPTPSRILPRPRLQPVVPDFGCSDRSPLSGASVSVSPAPPPPATVPGSGLSPIPPLSDHDVTLEAKITTIVQAHLAAFVAQLSASSQGDSSAASPGASRIHA